MYKGTRTSTPVEGGNVLDTSSCPQYEDWKLHLKYSTGKNLKVRGVKTPPKNFISGHLISTPTPVTSTRVGFTPRIDFIDAENQHLDEIYGDKAKIIDVVKPTDENCAVPEEVQEVLNKAITCATYAKQIEERNVKIKERILPMLQRGLQKLCFPKKFTRSWKKGDSRRDDEILEFLANGRDETCYKDTYLLVLH